MGILPGTGSQISMGRMRNAYGLGAGQVRLRADLGNQIGLGASNNVRESTDFGGKTTPNDY